jgi:hypothetical protein
MKRHLQNYHPEQYTTYLQAVRDDNKSKAAQLEEEKKLEEEVEQSQDDLSQVQGTSSQIKQRPVTTPITKYFAKGGPVTYKADSDFQRRAELDMAVFIATANLSFNLIESIPFKRFVKALNPKVNVRSRSALVKSIFPVLIRNLKETQAILLNENLPKVPGAGFTMDLWSSKGQHAYMSLTMQFIDKRWNMISLLMACSHVEEPSHTGDLIGEKVEGLLEKIPLPPDCHVAFTTDGAKNMIKAMRESLAVNEHVVCFCHVLSLCLQDAFAIPMIEKAIQVLKNLAANSHRSIKRITAIRRACNELDSE